MSKFIAHTQNDKNEYHYLNDHLQGTAIKAELFASKWGIGKLAYIVGLIHDLGKYSNEFQRYLLDNGSGVEHSIAGAIYINQEQQINYKDIISFVIAGHHAGLHNLADLKNSINNKKKKKYVVDSIKRFIKYIDMKKIYNSFKLNICMDKPLEVEFFIRMLFSVLVDADFLDTEKHFNLNQYLLRKKSDYDLNHLWDKFKKSQKSLMAKAKPTYLNNIRTKIYDTVVSKSQCNNGFFSLTVPTGGGKTRTGLAFALKHAIYNNMDRIIVVIPYTNIIEQTAEVYRNILGEYNILEHHSNLKLECDNKSKQNKMLKLASENWDMPVIITTSVQFFESIFASGVSKVRKNHNVTNSVIIFDEVQTLPPKFLRAILQIMKQLVTYYNSSIIFSTATQPAFRTRQGFAGIDKLKELAPFSERLYKKLKRVKFNFDYINKKIDWDSLVNKMLEKKQALTIVNTKDDAQEIFSILQDKGIDNIYHLSTYMCAEHRREVIKKIKELLDNNEQCYLVSTQLVEAGVDIDFPLVLRANGPLDSIVQAAGRCNREGNLKYGEVIVFEPEENNLPKGIYKTATGKTKLFLNDPDDLQKPEIFYDYFDSLYNDINLDKLDIQSLRQSFNYRKVNSRFKLIPDETANVIIENSKIIDELPVNLNVIKKKEFISREEWRKLQPFIVSIRKYKVNDLLNQGFLYELLEDVYIWTGKYDEKEGIKLDGFKSNDLIF